MHILFVADGDSKYGASNSLKNLVYELKKIDKKMEVDVVVTRHSSMVKDFENIGCKVYQIPYEPFYQGIPDSKIKFLIKYIVRGIQYLYGRLFAVKILEKQLDMHTIDLIHSNSSREDFGAILAKKYGIPLVWHIREFGDGGYRLYSYRKNHIEFMNETANKFICVSKAVKNNWIVKGLEQKRIVQIYDGVIVDSVFKGKGQNFSQGSISNISEKNHIMKYIMMGAMNSLKGQHIAIEAISLLPDDLKKRVHLDIVGDGSNIYTKRLKKLIRINHLENNISLIGYQKDFRKKINNYDCGLMCSRSEGFGLVTIEYMLGGVPVIASDCGANTELVENQVNGLLYRRDDSIDLMKKIIYFIENTDEVFKMGQNAYKIACEKYTAKINALKIYEEYQKILQSGENEN